MFDIARYYKAHSVAEAVALRQADPEARLLAGGTDVMIQLHHLNAAYRHIVDIHDLPELKGVCELPDGSIRIGSGTTFTEIIENELVQRRLPMLAEAAATIAGPQIATSPPMAAISAMAPPVPTRRRRLSRWKQSWKSPAPMVRAAYPSPVFTPVPARWRYNRRKFWWHSTLRRILTPMWAPTTSNTPCAMPWISPPSAAPPTVRLRMVTSRVCGWPMG